MHRFLGGSLLCLVSLILVSCGQAQPDVEQLGAGESVLNEVIPVETLAMWPRDFVDTFEVTGLIEADEDINISVETPGRVVKVGFEEGEAVEAGTLLIRLDKATVRAQIRKLEAMIARENTQLETARKDLAREKRLFEEGVGAEKSFDDAASRVQILENQVQEARAALDEARVLESKHEVASPASARIAMRHVSVGEYVNPGDPVANLVKIDVVKFRFALAERDIPRVRRGQELEFTIDAYPGLVLRGPVTAISPAGSQGTRTFSVTIEIKNLEERPLLPGMAGKVQVVRSEFENVYLVPEDTILRSDEGAYVYLVQDEKAQAVGVDIVSSSGPLAIIRGPLGEGSECVILGQYALSPDTQVRVRRKYEEPPLIEFD